jgi:hypothetical protein
MQELDFEKKIHQYRLGTKLICQAVLINLTIENKKTKLFLPALRTIPNDLKQWRTFILLKNLLLENNKGELGISVWEGFIINFKTMELLA